MDITQLAIAVVAVLGTLLVGVLAVVPTVLEFPWKAEPEPDVGTSPPTSLGRRRRHRDAKPAAGEADAADQPSLAA